MTSRESSPSSSLPDFVVPHDGTQSEIPALEQARVATKFSSLVGDLLLNHITSVEHYTHSEDSHLFLGLPVGEDGRWSVTVQSRVEPHRGLAPSEQTPCSINLQHMANGLKLEYLSYRLDSDGVVRRWTVDDMEARSQLQEFDYLSDEEMTDAEARTKARELLEQVSHEVLPNDRLEEEMGYNMQPVGLAEIEGLEAFLSQPGLESTR